MRSLLAVVGLVLVSGCTRAAPAWTMVDRESVFEALDSAGPVSMVKVHLGDSDTFRFVASPCEEVTVAVERGVVRAALDWFEPDDVVRFQAPAVIQAMSDDGADLLAVAVSHPIDHSSGKPCPGTMTAFR